MIGSDVNKGDCLMDQIKEDVIITNLQPEDSKEVTSGEHAVILSVKSLATDWYK